MKLQRLDHVAILVPHPDQSLRWYAAVLGLTQVHRQQWANNPAMMVSGNGTGLALFAPGVVKPHIAFGTDPHGFEVAQRELRERDIPYEYEDHGPTHSIYFADPDGTRLEITTSK